MNKNNNKGQRRQKKEQNQQIDLKGTNIQQLFAMAEQEYKSLSQQQQNKWHSIIARGGTRKDKIALMASEILKNPHTSLEQFAELTKWCFDSNHHFALDACRALVNIYNEYVFQDKKNLRIFYDSVQELISQGKKKVTASITDLVGFYLEHHIKQYYGELIRSIQELLTSSITFVKKTAIKLLAVLTRHNELRRMIINILINKFGDTDMDIVNETFKCLKTEFYQDLQSSFILLEEAQSFLFREHVSSKSQFYVINFLNNLNMKFLAEKGLSKLFELFYHFFEKLMGEDSKQGSMSSRLFLNSIKGLNKIFGFIKEGNKETKALIGSKIELVYKIVHTTPNIKAKIQLYLFLFQYHSHIHGHLTDRFYRTIYQFIGKPDILHCSLAQLFFDLILITLKQDQNINRVQAFIKRMLQLCLTAQANFIVTTLIMLGKVIEEKQALRIILQKKQNVMEEDGEESKRYDCNKREPIYAAAQNTLVWQLTVLANHFHPTVRKYAQHLIKGEQIPYDGVNPMLQLSTTSFLEKLVLRKQKKSQGWKLKNKKHLNKMRTSKYETLIDKSPEDFKEDEKFIKKYLEQRSTIHTNFRNKQPGDIEDFADQVIERQMDRLNPDRGDFDLSMSQQLQGEEQFEQGEGQQFEEDEQIPEDQMEADEFGSDDGFEGDQNGEFDEEMPEGEFDQDEEMEDQLEEDQEDEEEQDEKEFEEAFNEIGEDDSDYPKKQNIQSRQRGRGGRNQSRNQGRNTNKSRKINKPNGKGRRK